MAVLRQIMLWAVMLLAGLLPRAALAEQATPEAVIRDWYRLTLELVRHTPTYSPPVASRSLAYMGIAAFEAATAGSRQFRSLAGQLNGLTAVPARAEGAAYDEAVVIQATLAASARALFANTGPTGQRAMAAMEKRLAARAAEGVAPAAVMRSVDYGRAVAAHVLAWAETDGGAVVENMGFPLQYTPKAGPAHWVPTSLIAQQQAPLLPGWGENRPLAMPDGAACPLPPPPAYGEAEGSGFHREALEVYRTGTSLTAEQQAIARFWSDDPMLTSTPPGHWISIASAALEREKAGYGRRLEVLALLGIALSDSFIACWHEKYEFDLVRPVTYIRRLIDPQWEPLLITPPFPEYPSGHSTQSSAAAEVLTALFGENYAFSDDSHEEDGMPARSFASFRAAAEEAAISRLYGGIHFRAAIERGLDQGRCVAAHVTVLRTRP